MKQKIIEDDKIVEVLDALGCQYIKRGRKCVTASNPDGDNKTAINVYYESLNVLNHTRSDIYNKSEKPDIITLVEYLQNLYFTQAIKWICDVCGYSYYIEESYEKEKVIDPCIAFLDEVEPNGNKYEETYLRKLNDSVLNEYIQYPNIWFYNEGISLNVQKQFEIGFCVRDERITIPIRDELGNLVGVKARTVLDHNSLNIPKYLFPYPMPKSLILYGLDKAFQYIKKTGEVLVYESEKSVLKSFSMGFCNCVSIGGHELSSAQVLKLEKLGVDIILALDKDVTSEQIKKEGQKFILRDRIHAIIDHKSKVLGEKDAPVDVGLDNWLKLYTNDKYKVPV